MSTFHHHIERAIEASGSQAKLAAQVGCSQQYISWLLKEAKNVSAEMAIRFERGTDGAISRHELRADIFGPAPSEHERA